MQALCRDPQTGLEPWVGLIVGPYDQALESPSSRTQAGGYTLEGAHRLVVAADSVPTWINLCLTGRHLWAQV